MPWISELCREYGVSRETAYKWLERFKEEGFLGLEDHSRAPKHSPQALDGATVTRIVALRHAHPSWGAKKIAEILRRKGSGFTSAAHPPGRERRRRCARRRLRRAPCAAPVTGGDIVRRQPRPSLPT